MLEISKIAS